MSASIQETTYSALDPNEALHLIPRISRGNRNSRITPDAAFSHSLGHEETNQHVSGDGSFPRKQPRLPLRYSLNR